MTAMGPGRRLARFLPAAALYGVIFYLSSLESWPIEVGWNLFDKVAHASVFGLLGALLAFAFGRRAAELQRSKVWAPFGTAAFLAVLDEIHQAFVPGRDESPWDALADIVGIGLGIWVYRRLLYKKSGDT
jgi:VanZ family protein